MFMGDTVKNLARERSPRPPQSHLVSQFEEEARGMMPKTNTTPETSHEDKDRSAEYTQPKISDYGDLAKVTASTIGGLSGPA
jgi:hypothetical protein